MALATRLAWAPSRAPPTRTSINLVAPSPSRATIWVSVSATSNSAASKAERSTGPAAPEASTTAVSDVEVSVSTETQLNVRPITRRNTASRASAVSSASVKNMVMRVAMSGSIMPTPLATPTTRAAPHVAAANFGWVSVVMMPRATASASVPESVAGMDARPVLTRSIGYWRPITPVEAMSTSDGEQPSAAATPPTTVFALERPSAPVATLAFLEMTTIACAERSARWARLTTTLGPANRDFVNTPAAAHGRSAVTTTKSSVSSLMPMLAT